MLSLILFFCVLWLIFDIIQKVFLPDECEPLDDTIERVKQRIRDE